MPRPVTLFTGQWADLPLAELAPLARSMGYDGLELACWGDHFDVTAALEQPGYVDAKRRCSSSTASSATRSRTTSSARRCATTSTSATRRSSRRSSGATAIPRACGSVPPPRWARTAEAARAFGVDVVNGFTGSSIWHSIYAFPPTSQDYWEAGFQDFAERWTPIMDTFATHDVRFGLEVHPTEIAFDIASAERALEAIDAHPQFGFNYDPSHLAYQGVDYVAFIRHFADRLVHAHMKDVWWGHGDGSVGIFGGHTSFGDARRAWDFRSVGRGDVNFEEIIVALNDIEYDGPLSVEWEDSRMDRVHGGTESAAFLKRLDFAPSTVAFDAAFDKDEQ